MLMNGFSEMLKLIGRLFRCIEKTATSVGPRLGPLPRSRLRLVLDRDPHKNVGSTERRTFSIVAGETTPAGHGLVSFVHTLLIGESLRTAVQGFSRTFAMSRHVLNGPGQFPPRELGCKSGVAFMERKRSGAHCTGSTCRRDPCSLEQN